MGQGAGGAGARGGGAAVPLPMAGGVTRPEGIEIT